MRKSNLLARSRRGPHHDRANRRIAKLMKHYEGTLILDRRPPVAPSDFELLQDKVKMTPLVEAIVPFTEEMLYADFDPTSFAALPPPPLKLPAFALQGACDNAGTDPSTWVPSSRLHLDACVVVGGYERTDFAAAAEMLTSDLSPPLVPWTLRATPCVRLNLCPDIYGRRQRRAGRERPEDAVLRMEANDVVRSAMRSGTPLEAVEFTIGFSNGKMTFTTLHGHTHDRDRHHCRPALGFSLSLLQARLHPSVWNVARALHGHHRLKLGAVAPPPTFWLSTVAWYVAAVEGKHELFADGSSCKEGAESVLRFTRDACSIEALPASSESDTASYDALDRGELLALLRTRGQRHRPPKPVVDDDTTSRPRSSKPHYLWRNFFLPGEDLSSIATVAHFRRLMHSHSDPGSRLTLTDKELGDALGYTIPLHDTPLEYFAPLRVR